MFQGGRPNVGWITKALYTLKSKHLQHVSLQPPPNPTLWEAAHEEWLDIDSLLDQFRTSPSLRLKITDSSGIGWECLKALVAWSFPELTRRGIVDLVQFPTDDDTDYFW